MDNEYLQLVFAAIDEVNAQSVNGTKIEKSADTPLLGSEQGMDSLMFVNLIIALEEQIQTNLGKSVVLVDENSMSLEEGPFRTVATLAAYVEKVVGRQPS